MTEAVFAKPSEAEILFSQLSLANIGDFKINLKNLRNPEVLANRRKKEYRERIRSEAQKLFQTENTTENPSEYSVTAFKIVCLKENEPKMCIENDPAIEVKLDIERCTECQ